MWRRETECLGQWLTLLQEVPPKTFKSPNERQMRCLCILHHADRYSILDRTGAREGKARRKEREDNDGLMGD